MAIKPEYYSLIKVLESRLFGIPEYQRAYSWQKQQRKELFEDINKIMESSDTSRHHFMATIVCLQTDETEEIGTDELVRLDIVDGQQRLTTLIILLKAIALYLEKSSDEKDIAEAKKLNDLIVKDGGRLILLQTNHVSKIMFSEYLTNGTMPAPTDLTTLAELNLFQAFSECEKYVESFNSSEAVLNLLKTVKNRLDFIFYVLEDAGAVYTVFEVLNSRGLAVAWLDKCKSKLMGVIFEKCSESSARDKMIILHDIWSKIYSVIGKRVVPDNEVLATAATLYYQEGTLGKPLSVERSVECFTDIALLDPEKTIEISKWILDVAKALSKLYSNPRLRAVTDIGHARILAVAIELASHLTELERKEVLDKWEKVTFMIFGLHRKDSRTRVGDYIRVARKISQNAIPKVEALEEIGLIADRFSVEDAIESIMGENWYGTYDNDLKYLLYRYEEYLAQEQGEDISEDIWEKIWSNSAATTIEHIHPKTYDSKWEGKIGKNQEEIDKYVHTLGNLILLPPGVNSKAGQKIFGEKKEIYKSYHLLMMNEILDKDDWSKNEIVDREEKLLEFVEKTWKNI